MQMGPSFLISLGLALLALLGSGDPGVPRPTRCSLGRYHSLDSKTLAAVKTFRDLYEQEMLSWEKRNCSFSRRKEPRKVLGCTPLHPLAMVLANTEAVLRNLSSPVLAAAARPVLEVLSAVRKDVGACVTRPSLDSPSELFSIPAGSDYSPSEPLPSRPRALSRLAEPRLSKAQQTTQPRTRGPGTEAPGQRKWVQPPDSHAQVPTDHGTLEGVDRSSKTRRKNLQERRLRKGSENPRCLEAEIILNLLRVLIVDLKLAVVLGFCA